MASFMNEHEWSFDGPHGIVVPHVGTPMMDVEPHDNDFMDMSVFKQLESCTLMLV